MSPMLAPRRVAPRALSAARRLSTVDPNPTPTNASLLQKYAYPGKAAEDAAVLLSSLRHIKVTRAEASPAIATINFDRPTKGNALNMQTFVDLQNAFKYIASDNGVRVAILTGNSSAFCTGMDLEVFGEMSKLAAGERCEGRKREGLSRLIQFFQDAVNAPEVLPPHPTPPLALA